MRISPTIEYKGETKTLVEWSKHLGIRQNTLSERYRKGFRGDELFFEYNAKQVLIKYHGKTKTLAQWCKHYDVSRRTAYSRYRQGLDLDLVFSKEKLSRSKKSLDGFTYKGITKPLYQWCKEFNVNYTVVMYRIENRWPEDKIFEPATRSRPEIVIEYMGEKKPMTEWCRFLNIEYSSAVKKYNLGLPLDFVLKKLNPTNREKINTENHWFNKLDRIKKQEKAEKEITQALLGKMRRKRYLLFRRYLREAEAEAVMRVSA